jgi:hypothetical protein
LSIIYAILTSDPQLASKKTNRTTRPRKPLEPLIHSPKA